MKKVLFVSVVGTLLAWAGCVGQGGHLKIECPFGSISAGTVATVQTNR